MRVKRVSLLLMAAAVLGVGTALIAANGTGETPKMTGEELKGRLGGPELVVVDVRTEGSWADSATKIKGAVREDPTAVRNWIQKYPKDKTLVFYCS